MKQLEVGDRILYRNRYNKYILTVDRVTSKRAYAGVHGFIREVDNSGRIELYPREHGWDRYYAEILTDEIVLSIKKEKERNANLFKIGCFDFKRLTDGELNLVIEIINSAKARLTETVENTNETTGN